MVKALAGLAGIVSICGVVLAAAYGYIMNIIYLIQNGSDMQFIEAIVRVLGAFPFFFVGMIAGWIHP